MVTFDTNECKISLHYILQFIFVLQGTSTSIIFDESLSTHWPKFHTFWQPYQSNNIDKLTRWWTLLHQRDGFSTFHIYTTNFIAFCHFLTRQWLLQSKYVKLLLPFQHFHKQHDHCQNQLLPQTLMKLFCSKCTVYLLRYPH